MRGQFGSHVNGAMRVGACQRFKACVTVVRISGWWDWPVMGVGMASLQLSLRSDMVLVQFGMVGGSDVSERMIGSRCCWRRNNG
jgi:hypothetical protein